MKYGYFDDENKEYVITNPKTPVKWINYIGELKFGGFIDQTGGLLVCKGDPALNRIIKYIPQLPASDFNGSTLYLRINNCDEYKIFSPYYVPTLDSYESYECHVGLGYTRIISQFYGIKTDSLIFVPHGGSAVINYTKITNLREEPLKLDAVPAIEYTHFDALKQLTNADWVPQTMQSKVFIGEDKNTILTQYAFMNKDCMVNYLTSNLKASSFESDRENFLGQNGYGSFRLPLSLFDMELSNYEARRGNNIGALMHHLGNLAPSESRSMIFQLGQCENIENEKSKIKYFNDEKNVQKEFTKVKDWWNEYLSKIVVKTPDMEMNTMLNIHNPRQCYITKNWSRYLSLYQLGFGGRGIGVRDGLQDVMGVISHVPSESREFIEKIIKVQMSKGFCMHQFNPLTMEATSGDSREKEDRPDYYSDDHLWIILAVCSYLKETGDMDFLNKVIPYYDKGEDAVISHLKKAIEFTQNDLGKHGLPLLGYADWNDTVNLLPGAESFFTAELFGKTLLEMADLMNYLGEKKSASEYISFYQKMKENVNACGWDGKWYLRYFDYDGSPLGSSQNTYGKMYINSQSWSVISGFANVERAKTALDSVNKFLNTENGLKLSYPSYECYDEKKGGITTYPKGAKENGGIFLHCNPWVMIAETMVGNGDRAFKYYEEINPVYKNNKIDEYQCEPYCYAQNILGNEHAQFGLGRNSWLSGTSSWVYQAAIKHILGVSARYDGLNIDPCIPRKWKKFRIKRIFRNAVYDIEVSNDYGVCKGVKNIKVDDSIINGTVIPIFNDNKIHNVAVEMG